jgi:hypothetical protein
LKISVVYKNTAFWHAPCFNVQRGRNNLFVPGSNQVKYFYFNWRSYNMNAMKKTVLASALFMAMGSAYAAPVSTGGVFNMYSQLGLDQKPTNVLNGTQFPINVDTTITGFVDQAAGTWGVASSQPFFGLPWTASGGTLITAAGNYVQNGVTGAVTAAAPDVAGTADGMIHFTVGAGQVAGLINFAYGVTTNIRVVDVWNVNANGSLTAASVPGMENGPFPGFNAAFNLSAPGLVSAVPVPAAAWLLGSGLLGLVGVARRKVAVA